MEIDMNAAPQGRYVRTQDGTFFFMTNEQMNKSAVPHEDLAILKKLWEAGMPPEGVANPQWSCAVLKNYLDYQPMSDNWRRVSLIWADQCL